MILGRGTAQTDEAIIAEYQQWIRDASHLHHWTAMENKLWCHRYRTEARTQAWDCWPDGSSFSPFFRRCTFELRDSRIGSPKADGTCYSRVTLEYARILDQTVEQAFTTAVEHMQEGPHSWVPNFFVQEDYTLFVEGDAVSWIRLPLGFCRRNPKLHCESDVKCLLCDRFAIGKDDLPRLQQMYERFMKLGLKIKADVFVPLREENGHHLLLTEHHPPYSHARRGKGSEPVIYRKVTLFGRQGFMLTLF